MRCHVRVHGEGPPILLIHGVAGSGRIWGPVIERLRADHELIAVDLLGYGHSPKPRLRYTPDVHVEAIHASVADLLAGRPFSIMGLSMGAVLAAEYATRHPDDVQAIVHVGLPYYRDVPEARRGLRHNPWTAMTVYAPPLARVAIGVLWGLGSRSRVLSRLLGPRIYAGEVARESMMARYHSFSSTMHECLVQHRLTTLPPVPTAYVHGTDDKWCPAERVEALVAAQPESTFHLVEGGHNLVVLAPDEVARVARATFG